MTKLKNFIDSHINLVTIFGLGIVFYFIFFYNIGNYALMDVDESRYVTMARDMFLSKDYLTLYLNGEYFFEKPPLYFWTECLSFHLFGKVNEFTARFPGALFGTMCCYLLYFMGKKIVSRKFGIIASLILASSLEFVILAKFAILDIVVSTCIAFSLCFGLIVYFCRENHKKYYWWLFYIFSGLAVLAKGIPGFIIPFGSMFFIAIVSKKFKEIFKPAYFIPGMLLFFLIVLPWHIYMLKTYNSLFWDEYIIKHHVSRFLGSEVIDRSAPFYFYFVTLIWGFFPWIISCVTVWIKDLLKVLRQKKLEFKYENLNNIQRYILYNAIISVFILAFFTSSETKLITYILPIYLFLANLGAYIWVNYIDNTKNEKIINNTAYVLGGIMLLACLLGILTPLYLPEQIYNYILSTRTFCILTSGSIGLAIILFVKKKLYLHVFVMQVLFIMLFSSFATEDFFEIDYKFGQDDLMKFAQYANEKDLSLTTFDFGHKYSLMYYGETPVTFGVGLPISDLQKTLKKENNLVIAKIKDLKRVKHKIEVIDMGSRYALIDEVK